MKIALVQFEVKIHQALNQTLKRVEDFIKLAFKNKCYLICFPEDFLFGPFDYYSKKEIVKILDQYQKIINFFSQKAKKYQLSIIAGTIIRKIRNKLYNTCFVFNQKGEIIYNHNKQKLIPFGFEGKNLKPGKNIIKTFGIGGIKFGILICRELFYSQSFQKLRKQGVEIIFIPSFWSKRSSDYQKIS